MKDGLDQTIDQLAHFWTAFSVVLIAFMLGGYPTLLAGAFIGTCLGAVREVTEGGKIFSRGSLLDLLFWTLGGGFAGWLL